MNTMLKTLNLPADARTALEEVAAKYGMTVEATNIKRTTTGMGFWFQFEIADDAEKEERRKQEFLSNVHARVCRGRVKAEDFGRVFTHKGLRYRIVGINRDADKYPIQTEALDGGPNYRFPLMVACPTKLEAAAQNFG